jgi:glycosyltransferase involved in cell wall biosynthesis
MLFEPNIEAACFFVRDIWPRVREAMPRATFWIVGTEPSEAVRRLHSESNGVVVTGEVPDVLPYLQRSVAAIVPLKNGGGTRLKILEAMAAGRAVVSTSVGAEGLDVRTGENILIADDPLTFASHCISVLNSPDLRHRLAAAGRRLVEQRYSTAVTQARLRACYDSLRLP